MRLLLAEEEGKSGDLVKRGLSGAGFECDRVGTAGEAMRAVAAQSYAGVVIDLNFPGGAEALIAKGRAKGLSAPILIMSPRRSFEDMVSLLQAGANDYVFKPVALDELIVRIQVLVRRSGKASGNAIQIGNVTFDTSARQAFVKGAPRLLSRRELALLELLMRQPGHIIQKRAIEEHLFGQAMKPNSNAVEVYVHRLRKQLTEAGASVQVRTIREMGYIVMKC